MSGKVWFDPTSDKWALSDGEHYLEVPHWAREIIADEFERETRQLKTENDKLQNDADLLRAMWSQERTEKQCYMAENAKLRELVSGLEHCCQGFPCNRCPLYDPSGTNHRRCESLERELGVEVDE